MPPSPVLSSSLTDGSPRVSQDFPGLLAFLHNTSTTERLAAGDRTTAESPRADQTTAWLEEWTHKWDALAARQANN